MHNFKKLISVAIIGSSLLMASCSNGSDTPIQLDDGQTTIATTAGLDNENNNSDSSEYVFTYEGISIKMNTDAAPVIEALGTDYTYFESPSCAYQGMDKIYTYTFFTVYTYPSGDKDMISSVELKSDTLKTDEGIRIGSSEDEITKKYGDTFSVNGVTRSYTTGDTKLSFVITDGKVSGIVYDYAGLEQ